MSENERDVKRFKDLDWRLTLVTSCRARQKILVPKYTVKLDIAGNENSISKSDNSQSYVLDMDYTNLKRIQNEIEEALKAVDSTYSKKVFKFLK